MSLIAELKRRNVFKVGAAYLVVAWLVVQAASIAFPTFEAPAWALRVFIFVVMLGFPMALVIAWTLQLTPEGVRVERATAGSVGMYAVTGALAALAIAWYFLGQPSYRTDAEAPAAPVGPPSVAVLPFANLSSDPEQEFFSDGMTEELLNVLARVPSLKVAARTSVFEFKGKGGDVRAIGAKLGVSHIVEGSVRRDAGQVRVTAQLIRVADGFHVWSESYDRELKSVFALQDEIARRIAEQLKGSLVAVPGPEARPGIDPEAYDEYLKARAQYRRRRDLPLAVSRLEFVVERAPEFAAAWATLSLVHEVAYWTTTPMQRIALGEARPQMRAAAERAAALDPDAATTLHALANVARGEARFAEAERLYRRGMAADPTYADVREDLAELLYSVGRDEDGLAEARELVALEPLVAIYWYRIADPAALLDREDLVAEAASHMTEVDPDGLNTQLVLLFRSIYHGRVEEARTLFEVARKRAPGVVAEDWVLFRWSQGDPAVDDRLARAAIENNNPMAVYAALRGDADLFFASVATTRDPQIGYNAYSLLRAPIGQRYLGDPRAKRLLRDFGFEAYWREKGWPPLCRPLGDDDFECGPPVGPGT